jgi:general stress protein 26
MYIDHRLHMSPQVSFEDVERTLRRYNFGTLSTVDRRNRSHSIGLIYAVSDQGYPLRIYAMTQMKTRKVRNIKANPNVSFVVQCPRILSMVPPSVIQFQGTAEILAVSNEDAMRAFRRSYLLRMMLDKAEEIDLGSLGEACYIAIKPDSVIHTYGVGLSMWQLYKHIEDAGSRVKVPDHAR